MRRLYASALVLVTILASHPASSASEVNGSLKGLCLVSEGEEIAPLKSPRAHFELIREAATHSNPARLVARFEIRRADLHVTAVKLAASIDSMKDISFELFKSFCGGALVYGNTLGQSVEATWTLQGSEKSSEKNREVFASNDVDLDQLNEATLAQFATKVAETLSKFDGQIVGSTLNAQPANAIDANHCAGVLDCFTNLLRTTPRSAQIPLNALTLELTPEIVRSLQRQSRVPLKSIRPG